MNEIILGDAYKLIKDIPDKSVDLIVTDPPYEIEGIHPSGIIKGRYGNSHAKKIKDTDLDKSIDFAILDDFVRVMRKINIYIFCNKEQIIQYLDFFVKKHHCNWEILIWVKENPAPFCGTHYLKDKEYCLYFWEQGADGYIPYDRAKTYFISKTNKADKDDYDHPTIKPIELIKTLIMNSTDKNKRGGVEKNRPIVFDPFVGSGTTCVAAKELGCNYIGFEINENYYKIAVDRLNGVNQKGQIDLFSCQQLDLFNEGD